MVHVACSDCPEELEIVVDELGELDGLGCECGYGFDLVSISEVELVPPRGGEVIELRRVGLRRAA
jgi:hypothetical protein